MRCSCSLFVCLRMSIEWLRFKRCETVKSSPSISITFPSKQIQISPNRSLRRTISTVGIWRWTKHDLALPLHAYPYTNHALVAPNIYYQIFTFCRQCIFLLADLRQTGDEIQSCSQIKQKSTKCSSD